MLRHAAHVQLIGFFHELQYAAACRSACNRQCPGLLTHGAADFDQGLPDWDEILERGDEEEKLERAQRRSRERKLQEEFAEKRVRVVDDLGRSYATGETVWRLGCPHRAQVTERIARHEVGLPCRTVTSSARVGA